MDHASRLHLIAALHYSDLRAVPVFRYSKTVARVMAGPERIGRTGRYGG